MGKDKGGVASLAQPNPACLSTSLLTFRIVVSIVFTVFTISAGVLELGMYLSGRAYETLGLNPGSDCKAAKSRLMPCPDLDLFFVLYKYLQTEPRFLAYLDPGSSSYQEHGYITHLF